ncbi:MAG: hypothetical protein ACOC1F_07300, partial [Myxococcota bacterium]
MDGGRHIANAAPRARLHPAWAAALAAVSGVLYYGAFPGVGLWPLAFIAFVPLLIALRGRS